MSKRKMINEDFERIVVQLSNVINMLTEIHDNRIFDIKKISKYGIENKKTIIHQEGMTFDYVLFLGKGMIRSYWLSSEGKEVTYFFFKENEFVCDFESFISGDPGNYFFETIEDCQYIKINRKDVYDSYTTSQVNQKLGRILAEQAYLQVERRLRMFMTLDLELKYKALLRYEPELINRVPQYYLASYLGVSPEALSRMKSHLKLM